jgi:phosphocarrier protein
MQTSPISRVVVVRNKLGMHIRPWTEFTQLAGKFQARIEVLYLGRRVDSRSPIELLTLAAGKGAELRLEASGPDAQQALDALADFVENVVPLEDIEQDERPGED